MDGHLSLIQFRLFSYFVHQHDQNNSIWNKCYGKAIPELCKHGYYHHVDHIAGEIGDCF
jgi:hypothetical protein